MISGIVIKPGVYGDRVLVTSEWSLEIERYIIDNRIVEIELNTANGWRGDNILFLEKLTFLKSLDIIDFDIKNIDPIHNLRSLRSIKLNTYSNSAVDFSLFPLLQSCVLEWGRKMKNLSSCEYLDNLFINRYQDISLSDITGIKRLKSLSILNSPIVSLSGIDSLVELRSLRLGNLNKLLSLDGVEQLKYLEELDINTCRRIQYLSPISGLYNLRRLFINNGGKIESLSPLNNLVNLEVLSFYESTNIVDGDLSVLLTLESLASVSFQNRRHYNLTREQIVNAIRRKSKGKLR